MANPLLLFATDYVFENIDSAATPLGGSNLPPGYDPAEDPESVRTVLRRVAKAIISEDINGDGIIDWQDLVSFHPLTDQTKSRIPWDYVVSVIERRRQAYFATLDLHYAVTTYMDKGTIEPYDWDGSGNWHDDIVREEDRSFVLQFETNKNGYTPQDLLNGQGDRGGSVTFPQGNVVTYYYGYPCEGQQISGQEIDVNEVPLDLRCVYSDNRMLTAQAGGNITNPAKAPVGDYLVEYATGDGLTHQENIYVFENKEKTFFYPIPEIKVDEEGRITLFSIRFEDEEGNILDDPPILRGAVYFQLWAPINAVNNVLRGGGYYSDPFGNPSDVDTYAYQADINLIDPTEGFFPMSNDNLIYLEDLASINFWCLGGDGVVRANVYSLLAPELQPQLSIFSIDNGQLDIAFSPSPETGREVVSIKYRFDDSTWVEVSNSHCTVEIPAGALEVWLSAKDSSGYYTSPGNIILP